MRRKNYKLWLVMLVILLTLVGCGQKHKEIQKHEENKTQSDQVLCKANFCKESALAASGCCEAHTCQVAGCQNATAARWGKYCQEHMCSREGCSNPRAEGSTLCAAHNDPNQLCEAEGCTRLKIIGEKYCSSHKAGYTCNYWNCKNESKEGSYFCAEHQSMQCKYENCHDPVGSLSDYKNTNYCSYHGCHYPDCNKQSNGNSFFGYCDYHEKVRLENSSAVFNNDYVQDTATMGEKNALKKAQDYLAFTAFSYTGLIDQLEFEGYTYQEALYGVNNCGADWNEQAAKKAAQYLEFMAFSRQGLIEQLEYEGFTHEQAVYGVTQNGY